MSESKKIAEFWTWFSKNETPLRTISSSDERDALLDSLHERIQRIHEGIGCEVGSNDPPELYIVAYGNAELFDLVDRIVSEAPVIEDWKLHPLAPARGFEFQIEWNNVPIDCNEVVFEVLSNPQRPQDLGIQLLLPDALFDMEDQALNAAYRIVETGIGERATALKIQHIDVQPIGDNDRSELLPLKDLEDYIRWHDKKFNRV